MDKNSRDPQSPRPGLARPMARRVVPKEAPAPHRPRTHNVRGTVKIVAPTIKTHRVWQWRRALRWPWLRLAVALLSLGSVYVLFTSQAFAIHEIQAVGDARLPLRQLEQQCACVGTNIFTVQVDTVRRRLAAIPMLIIDDVYGRLPNRLVVQAHYKQPDMIWRGQNGYFLVDAQGQVMARAVGRTTYPVVTLKRGQRLELGQRMDTAAMATVHDLIRYLPASLRGKISAFNYSPTSGVTIVRHKQWYATFGTLTGTVLQERIIIFQWMLSQRGKGRVPTFNYADLQYSRPYVRRDADWPWDKLWIK